MLKEVASRYLSDRSVAAGETVQVGWFIFRLANDELPRQLETLDFRKIASFTADFSEAERIHQLQQQTLRRHGLDEEECTLRQFALVSTNYSPNRRDAIMTRQQRSAGNDSGWFVGVLDEESNKADPQSFIHRSLYELSIHDRRLLPFWLLPVGKTVHLENGEIVNH